jgi:hypothetical protein
MAPYNFTHVFSKLLKKCPPKVFPKMCLILVRLWKHAQHIVETYIPKWHHVWLYNIVTWKSFGETQKKQSKFIMQVEEGEILKLYLSWLGND